MSNAELIEAISKANNSLACKHVKQAKAIIEGVLWKLQDEEEETWQTIQEAETDRAAEEAWEENQLAQLEEIAW